MTCAQVMTREPKCCIPSDPVSRVAKIMKIEDVGSLPVCSSRDSRRLVGIVTDRDLALQVVAEDLDAGNTTVADVMSEEPVTCRMDEDVEIALGRMEANQVRRIPVVDEDGALIGIIAQADVATRVQNAQKTAEVVSEISQPRD
jgi:CBS domain-containing protein